MELKKEFNTYINTLRQKGNLVYEYNPLYNYLTDVDLYIYEDKYIIPSGKAINKNNGEILTNKEGNLWVDKRNRVIDNSLVVRAECGELWAKAGSIIDLDTELLNFDLNHPVDIEVQPSYDGSVNLIINDNKTPPKLINSRFSVREKNTYEIVDRIGENDTNIYNSSTFDKDTSLYFLYKTNPIINYLGLIKGVLPVGQYCFYFTYCDADNNESDIVAESGLIPVFLGNDSDPTSIDGGIKNLNSYKGINLKLENIDKSYNYLKVYYVRYFADYNLNRIHECKKIYLKYAINSSIVNLLITGNELTEDLDPNILNISKFNPKSILTLALCKNILFFGNIVKNSDNYRELTDLALRITPELNIIEDFDSLNKNYLSEKGDFAYYNSKNIYNKTGYFNLEYYRFGVVFIYLDGSLSNVYNTLGGTLSTKGENINIVLENNGEKQLFPIYTQDGVFLYRNYIKIDDKGWIKNDDSSLKIIGENVNSKGVCHLNYIDNDKQIITDKTLFSIKFNVPKEVSEFLKEELNIRGLFFVRLKCIPNIIAQCYLLPMDEVLQAPVIEVGDSNYYSECFVSDVEQKIRHDYISRLYKYGKLDLVETSISTLAYAGICPDFLLNLPYYNQIFNGGKFKLLKITNKSQSKLSLLGRFLYEENNVNYTIKEKEVKVTISSVTEDVPVVALKDKIFRTEIGKTEEAYMFRYAEMDNGTLDVGSTKNTKELKEINKKINKAVNLVRGKYSPYLAIYSELENLETGCLYNIYLENSLSQSLEFLTRMDSYEPFYAISDRYNIINKNLDFVCWRGDCYINLFTYRLNRNFNDPSLPNNDTIIDPDTWKDNYKAEDSTKWKDISRSDINAVKIGTWITFKVRSSMNYALRSVDHSYVSEEALMGSPRSFYPRSSLLEKGENKMPDSYLYNDAYRASLGFKCYFALLDINYIKNTFSNRIQYSAISILDSYKNNFRYSLSTYFRDYSLEYGSIQKLIGFEGHLLVIFEHAIGIAVVNERVLAGSGDGEPVFINTKNVLPEELTIISDTYGSLWPESIIKSEAGYVYGLDTIAKKIWRVKGQLLEILSDFKVNKFLIDNITLGERELYPIIGLKNVKTHYNNNKKDIIFTFYDDIYKDEEKVWSLCYNELLGEFITFYSWIPSYSANIDTKFFTFDRNTSKELTLLLKCNYSIPENTGVVVDSPVIKLLSTESGPTLYYISPTKSCLVTYTLVNADNTTTLKVLSTDTQENESELNILEEIKFRLEKDHWNNYKLFDINENNELVPKSIALVNTEFLRLKVILLYITPYLENSSDIFDSTTTSTNFLTEVIALTLSSIVENPLLTSEEKNRSGLTTDFYLHGLAGIFDVVENLYPTYWYGQFHPFEFEFVVNDKIGLLKIFTDLVIISNKAEPESFHFEIEGDNYEFSSDKRNMYFRLEATKNLYLNLGSDIIYNRYYTDVAASKYTLEEKVRPLTNGEVTWNGNKFKPLYDKYPIHYHEGLTLLVKSTIFPLYYERIDTFNDIYHKYHMMHSSDGVYNFLNLSGSEISWNRDLNQFNVVTHIKNSPIDLYGILRGNSMYKEGSWNIQIPSIIFMLKNEEKWNTPIESGLDIEGPLKNNNLVNVPPIVINSQYVPKDLDRNQITIEDLPNIYTGKKNYPEQDVNYLYNYEDEDPAKYVDTSSWTSRKEARIRDKWMKVRIRYSGKNLAIIHSLVTLYNISQS